MPFFLLHQPVILALAFYVVRWHVGIPIKLVTVLVPAFLVTAGLAWMLSRARVTRRLLGVKDRRPGYSAGPVSTH